MDPLTYKVPSTLGFGYFYKSVWEVGEVRALGQRLGGVKWGEKVLGKKAVGKGRRLWPQQGLRVDPVPSMRMLHRFPLDTTPPPAPAQALHCLL